MRKAAGRLLECDCTISTKNVLLLQLGVKNSTIIADTVIINFHLSRIF